MSRQYEYQLAAAADENSDETVTVVFGGGMSGNVRIPQPDLFLYVFSDPNAFAIEVKRTTQDALYIEKEELEQLHESAGLGVVPLLFVRFTNKEALCIPIPYSYSPKTQSEPSMEHLDVPDAFDAAITDAGSLRLRRPGESWKSARIADDDHEVLLEVVGYDGGS